MLFSQTRTAAREHHDFAAAAQVVDVLSKNDFHRLCLFLVRDVRQQRTPDRDALEQTRRMAAQVALVYPRPADAPMQYWPGL